MKGPPVVTRSDTSRTKFTKPIPMIDLSCNLSSSFFEGCNSSSSRYSILLVRTCYTRRKGNSLATIVEEHYRSRQKSENDRYAKSDTGRYRQPPFPSLCKMLHKLTHICRPLEGIRSPS